MGVERAREGDRRDAACTSRDAGADEFSRSLAKVAVAQVCQGVGYEHFKDPALETLADFAVRYILHLGKTATSFANLTGRSQCNVFDIVLALEDLSGEREGFSSEGNCVARSRKLREIIDFMGSSEEIPFGQPFPNFPVAVSDRYRKMTIPSFVQMGENPPAKHIPGWLPAFPDPHTYKQTPMWIERASDPRADKIEQARQRRKAERALLSLQQKLVRKISSGNSMWGDMDNVKEELREDESKLHDVSLLEMDEKDDAGNRNDLSVTEAFASAIEASKDGLCDEVDIERKEKKSIVPFKIQMGKKLHWEPLDLSLQKKGEGRPIPFLRDEDRDDKRRRAEFILRQCMENPVDLNQL